MCCLFCTLSLFLWHFCTISSIILLFVQKGFSTPVVRFVFLNLSSMALGQRSSFVSLWREYCISIPPQSKPFLNYQDSVSPFSSTIIQSGAANQAVVKFVSRPGGIKMVKTTVFFDGNFSIWQNRLKKWSFTRFRGVLLVFSVLTLLPVHCVLQQGDNKKGIYLINSINTKIKTL